MKTYMNTYKVTMTFSALVASEEDQATLENAIEHDPKKFLHDSDAVSYLDSFTVVEIKE